MTSESKGQICVEDPQNVTFRKAAYAWISGEISYEQLMGLYPTYLLRPHERVARLLKKAVGTFLNNPGTPQQ
jgi:hypothetical protein